MIEMENPMEAARKRRGNKSKAKVQNQGKITKKKEKEEEAGLELEMTAVSGAGDGAGAAAAYHPAPSNSVKRRGGRSEDEGDDDIMVRRKVPVENPIPGGSWTACIDNASGNTYYYQSGTGKVQWEMPELWRSGQNL